MKNSIDNIFGFVPATQGERLFQLLAKQFISAEAKTQVYQLDHLQIGRRQDDFAEYYLGVYCFNMMARLIRKAIHLIDDPSLDSKQCSKSMRSYLQTEMEIAIDRRNEEAINRLISLSASADYSSPGRVPGMVAPIQFAARATTASGGPNVVMSVEVPESLRSWLTSIPTWKWGGGLVAMVIVLGFLDKARQARRRQNLLLVEPTIRSKPFDKPLRQGLSPRDRLVIACGGDRQRADRLQSMNTIDLLVSAVRMRPRWLGRGSSATGIDARRLSPDKKPTTGLG